MIKMSKRAIYFLFLFVVMLYFSGIRPTFAKFSDDYITEQDVALLNLNFNLGIQNIEEYEEVKVEANSYEVFNVNILNSTSTLLYYGVWYKMVNPIELTNDIKIARLEDNLVEMSGELDSNSDKTVSVIIKNNSVNDIIVNIGVASSMSSVQDIEYLGGKHLIVGSLKEIDYYYDDNLKRYVSYEDNNSYFMLNHFEYGYKDEEQIFLSNHIGSYRVEAWGASDYNEDGSKSNGGYVSGVLNLNKNDKLYLYVGKKDNKNNTNIRLISNTEGENESLASKIMFVGTDHTSSYVSGHFGSIATYFEDDSFGDRCLNGLEDVACSYHSSGKIFTHTTILDGNSDISTFDGKGIMKGNQGDGYVKITAVVPTLNISDLKLKMGDNLNVSDNVCQDNGSGCHLVRILPDNVSELAVGSYQVYFMVSDDNGVVYRYQKKLEIIE